MNSFYQIWSYTALCLCRKSEALDPVHVWKIMLDFPARLLLNCFPVH